MLSVETPREFEVWSVIIHDARERIHTLQSRRSTHSEHTLYIYICSLKTSLGKHFRVDDMFKTPPSLTYQCPTPTTTTSKATRSNRFSAIAITRHRSTYERTSIFTSSSPSPLRRRGTLVYCFHRENAVAPSLVTRRDFRALPRVPSALSAWFEFWILMGNGYFSNRTRRAITSRLLFSLEFIR